MKISFTFRFFSCIWLIDSENLCFILILKVKMTRFWHLLLTLKNTPPTNQRHPLKNISGDNVLTKIQKIIFCNHRDYLVRKIFYLQFTVTNATHVLKLVLVLTCLGGQFRINCSSAFLKILKIWEFQNFPQFQRWFIPKIAWTKHVVNG